MSKLQLVIDIAKQASEVILAIYHSDNFDIHYKLDDSPLTRADLAANKIIIAGLKEISDFPVVSEEEPVEYVKRKNWEKYWLVDPLDGTKNFIAKDDGFTINIALIHGNNSILGVVYIPVSGDVYYAEKGHGAYKNGEVIFNHSKRTDLIASDSVFHSTAQVKDFFVKHKINNINKFGSSIKICKLAEGAVDVYPRLNGTKEWDTAACHIIANEAGCKLIDVQTRQELQYNKEKIENNHFIASRNDLNFLDI